MAIGASSFSVLSTVLTKPWDLHWEPGRKHQCGCQPEHDCLTGFIPVKLVVVALLTCKAPYGLKAAASVDIDQFAAGFVLVEAEHSFWRRILPQKLPVKAASKASKGTQFGLT